MKIDKIRILIIILFAGFYCDLYGQENFISINGKRIEILVSGLECMYSN